MLVDGSLETPDTSEVVFSVPEIRDYRAINGELVRSLDQGISRFRLIGVNGHRLLVSGLVGPWNAVIEVVGDAGPEVAADMDAPGITVVCRGSAADGGAARLKAGRVLVLGSAGPAFGYTLRGGLAMVVGAVGPRAGLRQVGGDLILLGPAGAMAGERQLGGRIFTHSDLGYHIARGRQGGRFIHMELGAENLMAPDDLATLTAAFEVFAPWYKRPLDQRP